MTTLEERHPPIPGLVSVWEAVPWPPPEVPVEVREAVFNAEPPTPDEGRDSPLVMAAFVEAADAVPALEAAVRAARLQRAALIPVTVYGRADLRTIEEAAQALEWLRQMTGA